MSNLLTALGEIFDSVMMMIPDIVINIFGGTIGEGADAVTVAPNYLLILFILIPLVGIGVGLFKRLINVN